MHIRPWSLSFAEKLLHSPLMMTQSTFYSWARFFLFFFWWLNGTALTRLIPVAFSQIIVAAQDFLSSYANNQTSASAADVGSHRLASPLPEESWEPLSFAAYNNKGSSQSALWIIHDEGSYLFLNAWNTSAAVPGPNKAPPHIQQGQSDWAGLSVSHFFYGPVKWN